MPVNESREFSVAAIASLSSGILLCPFEEMHEAAEYLMGHPIWTHHFASKDLSEAMRHKVLEQCPGMPTVLANVTHENYERRVAEIEAEFGSKVVRIRKGDGSTARSPLDGIPDGKPVTLVAKEE